MRKKEDKRGKQRNNEEIGGIMRKTKEKGGEQRKEEEVGGCKWESYSLHCSS